jgi:hypothetical protein
MGILLPILGSILGSVASSAIGQAAARPAQQAQEQTAKAYTDVINALLGQYKSLYAPYEQALVSRQAGLLGQIPIEEITLGTLQQLLGPFQMPPELVTRALLGVQQQTDVEEDRLRRDLARRGIEGPAAEAMIRDLRERGLTGKYGVLSQVMTTEAEQTLANIGKAFDIANTLLGQGLQTASSGRAMLPGAMTGLQNLMGMYGQAAQAAQQPWAALASQIPSMVYSYYTRPQTYQPMPGVSYSGGGTSSYRPV